MDSNSGGPFSGPMSPPATGGHPVLSCAAILESALKDVLDVPTAFMSPEAKAETMLTLSRVGGMLEGLRMRVVASSADVADQDGCRDVTGWLTPRTRADRVGLRRMERLAGDLEDRWQRVGAGVGQGRVNLDQAQVIVRALNALGDEVDKELLARAEAHLVELAAEFGPVELRRLGDRILELVCPEAYEDEERRKLEAAQQRASAATRLSISNRGDGSADIRGRIPEAIAARLKTYLEAYTSPRHDAMTKAGCQSGTPTVDRTDPATGARLPHDRVLGEALCAFLEAVDPHRMPIHGGNATKIIVTIALADLIAGIGVATLGDGTRITAADARRMACTAGILPAVLGGKSEVLDWGRERRLYDGKQRQAMALGHPTCRAEHCTIPAQWCEAHHLTQSWATGGRTDLKDGSLLCPWHHHRIHDPGYGHDLLPNGDVRFHKRR